MPCETEYGAGSSHRYQFFLENMYLGVVMDENECGESDKG
jgi:hypothetical protein